MGAPTRDRCHRLLDGQAIYGLTRAIADHGAIALGRNLYPTLPEDVFDRGPQRTGNAMLVADVRLDNRAELAALLRIPGPQQQRMSDSEILLLCLIEWADKGVDRLVGEFAFAFWDGTRQELVLARDFLGLRPLHYHCGKDFFALASMPSGLHALPDVPYDFDSDFMAESLALIPPRGTATHFREIQRVEPGTVVRIDSNGVRSQRFWDPPRPSASRLSIRDYEEGLRHVFDVAVRSQLRGAGTKVATHLSAGLDSSTVTATAARLMPEGWLTAFTAAPRAGFAGKSPIGTIADESELAARTAALYPNVEHVLIDRGSTSPLDGLDRDFHFQQQPSGGLCNAVWAREILRSVKERGMNTLLTGAMGNLSFSYAGLEWLPHLLRTGRIGTLARLSAGLLRNGMGWTSLGARIVGPFLPEPVWLLLTRIGKRAKELSTWSAVNPTNLRSMQDLARERGWDLAGRPRSDPFETRRWVYSMADGGNYGKGVLAEWGVSVRDPTADKRVIEYCLSVPYEEFLRGGVPRSLARRAFADRLPPAVARLQQRGYQSADWYEALGADRARLNEEVAAISRCSDAGTALDFKWLADAVRTWPGGDWDSNAVIMRYRWGLLRGISAGHFMRKVRGTN